MKKSRKLAWVVLGVVVVAILAMGLKLSSLYSDWEPSGLGIDHTGGTTQHWKISEQRFPWLPGSDRVRVEISKEEWVELSDRILLASILLDPGSIP